MDHFDLDDIGDFLDGIFGLFSIGPRWFIAGLIIIAILIIIFLCMDHPYDCPQPSPISHCNIKDQQ